MAEPDGVYVVAAASEARLYSEVPVPVGSAKPGGDDVPPLPARGSVVEVLWDFPFHKLVTEDSFLEKIYWNHHCGSFSGVCR